MKAAFNYIALTAACFLVQTGSVLATTTTVSVVSTLNQTNLTSGGQPLTAAFTFELGCFKNNFVPSGTNTADWLEDWVPLSDATGDPLPGATVSYDDSEVGPPWPPGTKVNNFTIEVPFTHNNAPFTTNNQFYIWGFDNRTEDGPGQWILITDPNWMWPTAPDNTSAPTQLVFDVASATTAVIGSLNTGGVEMQTAAVTVVSATLPPYELWLQTYFDQATLDDPNLMDSTWGVLADPDNDEFSNIIEYYIGTSPIVEISKPAFEVSVEEGEYSMQYNRSEEAPGTNGRAEWSTDLLNWSATGISETLIPGEEGEVTVINSVAIPSNGRIFMRLWVERVLEE